MSGPLFADRVKESTTTTGTGTVTLAGAASGYQSFAAIGNGNSCYYCIADQSGTDWEVGLGTYTSSGTTLSRTTVLASSNSGALVSFPAGTKDVFCVVPAGLASTFPGITASATAPTSPRTNDLWLKTDEGALKVYYTDANGSQWIDVVPAQPIQSGLQKLGKVVCVGGETTITFNNIPQSFSDLRLVITGCDTNSGIGDSNLYLKVNGDGTSGNYVNVAREYTNGTTVFASQPSSSANGGVCGFLPGTNLDANAVGSAEISILNYAGTSFRKYVHAVSSEQYYGSAMTQNVSVSSFVWANTAAITSLMLTAGGTAFAAGTTATLYGLG
jgi:hypothetical protein